MKKNRASMIVNIISIIIYVIITFFFGAIIVNAMRNTSDAEEVILGITFLFLLIVYGSIGYLIVIVMNIVSLVLALIAQPKKASLIISSIIFMLLPAVTEVATILLLTKNMGE